MTKEVGSVVTRRNVTCRTKRVSDGTYGRDALTDESGSLRMEGHDQRQ